MKRSGFFRALLRRCACVVVVGVVAVGSAAIAQNAFVVPDWVYPMNPPAMDTAPAPDDRDMLYVPNSAASFTWKEVKDLFAVPDWHAAAHPPMPEIVARGRKPAVYACGYCHLPDGTGRPENASLAGLPAEYIVAQVMAIRRGERRSAANGAYLPIEFMRTAANR